MPRDLRLYLEDVRDFLGHVYFAINLNILWQVTSINVPELLPQIERILDVEFGDDDLGSAPSG